MKAHSMRLPRLLAAIILAPASVAAALAFVGCSDDEEPELFQRCSGQECNF
jgi:hypothetical protein